MSDFDWIFDFVVASEGGFTDNPADPGNWTSGRVGSGICRGTKFGISAAAHSDLTHPSVIKTTFRLYFGTTAGITAACDAMGAVSIIGRWKPFV